MVIDLLSYNTSPLNLVLKVVILCLFLGAAWLYYKSRKKYGGILHAISSLLLIGAIAGVVSAWFRLQGDFYIQYKWGESLLNVVLVFLMLVMALMIRKRLTESLAVFNEGEE